MGFVKVLSELALVRPVPEDVSPELARELGNPDIKEIGTQQKDMNNQAIEVLDQLPEVA